jgi:L-asparagine transporter-like permease
VLVFEKVGIPYAADIFNFVILTAILSAANSGCMPPGACCGRSRMKNAAALLCPRE